MRALVVIPARKGSKGVPGKNKKILGNLPLISYTIDAAMSVFDNDLICVSTNDEEVFEIAKKHNIKPPFIRPDFLATDLVGSYEVLIHAIEFYEKNEFIFDTVVLLQATSPFRTAAHIEEAIKLYKENIDMVVSVCESKANPYFNLFEEKEGFLFKCKDGNFNRRQDCPTIYEYNGAIYIINKESLKRSKINEFKKVTKYVMDEKSSHDIDTEFDWMIADNILLNFESKLNN